MEIAKQLIDLAVRCNCDAVKFQKRDIETVYSPDILDSYRKVQGILKDCKKRD